jgi:hypothetical protein
MTSHEVIIQYKPTKAPFLNNILIFNFLTSSMCFEPEGSSSGRQLYIQVYYGIVCFMCISINSLVDRRVHNSWVPNM